MVKQKKWQKHFRVKQTIEFKRVWGSSIFLAAIFRVQKSNSKRNLDLKISRAYKKFGSKFWSHKNLSIIKKFCCKNALNQKNGFGSKNNFGHQVWNRKWYTYHLNSRNSRIEKKNYTKFCRVWQWTKAYLDLTTTLSLDEVWWWRPTSSLVLKHGLIMLLWFCPLKIYISMEAENALLMFSCSPSPLWSSK